MSEFILYIRLKPPVLACRPLVLYYRLTCKTPSLSPSQNYSVLWRRLPLSLPLPLPAPPLPPPLPSTPQPTSTPPIPTKHTPLILPHHAPTRRIPAQFPHTPVTRLPPAPVALEPHVQRTRSSDAIAHVVAQGTVEPLQVVRGFNADPDVEAAVGGVWVGVGGAGVGGEGGGARGGAGLVRVGAGWICGAVVLGTDGGGGVTMRGAVGGASGGTMC